MKHEWPGMLFPFSRQVKDDRGNRLALYYNTFGDYRPTGIFYLTIPSIIIFGRNEFAVRFPSAFLGALTVFPLYLFVYELKRNRNISLVASLLLAISPWHIEVSRATSEVAISAFFALFGLFFCIRLIKENKKNFLWASFLFFLVSYLLYHAIRFLGPFFIGAIIIFYWRQIRKSPSLKKLVFLLFGLVLTLSLLFSATSESKMRLSQVSIWKDVDINYELGRVSQEEEHPFKSIKLLLFHNKPFVYARRFINEYSTYLSADFLVVSIGARPYRYITPGVGLLTFVEALFFIFGLIQIIKEKENALPLFLLLISPIPAAVTTEDAPNLHRAFFMILFITIIEAYGFKFLSKVKFFNKGIVVAVSTLLVLNLVYFSHMYFDHSKLHKPLYLNVDLDASSYRNVGSKELSYKLEEAKGKYEKIIVSNFPDDPYPWYAFFTKKDPQTFNKFAINRQGSSWNYENIIFSTVRCPSDNSFVEPSPKRLLVIDSGFCPYESKLKDRISTEIVDEIRRPDGSVVYVFWARK